MTLMIPGDSDMHYPHTHILLRLSSRSDWVPGVHVFNRQNSWFLWSDTVKAHCPWSAPWKPSAGWRVQSDQMDSGKTHFLSSFNPIYAVHLQCQTPAWSWWIKPTIKIPNPSTFVGVLVHWKGSLWAQYQKGQSFLYDYGLITSITHVSHHIIC